MKIKTPCLTQRINRPKVLPLLLLLIHPALVQAQFIYTTNNGAITITGYDPAYGGVVAIPSTINGLPVTSIGDNAFAYLGGLLTSVTIPDGVTNIGNAAFQYCSSLSSITIPDTVTSIGESVFVYCSDLTNVAIGSSITTIGYQAFASTGLTSFTIPSNVTSIGQQAFINCSSLTSVTIPNTITSTGEGVFAFCTSLTNVTIPNSLTSIGPDAFLNCTGLTTATIGNSVRSIGAWAFSFCTSLANITISANVTNIGGFALSGCARLSAITVDANNPTYTSVDGVLFNKSQTTLIQCPGDVAGSFTIPAGITSIGGGAFMSCPNLTNVTIPASVTSIGGYAFWDCFSLTSVYFGGDAPSADSSVFTDDPATVYYLPGTTGWANFSSNTGRPTGLWFLPNPLILSGPGFGVQTDRFGFTISWATNIPVVVEACTNLANHSWAPVGTNNLVGGSSYFSDPQWKDYARRFYRLRSP